MQEVVNQVNDLLVGSLVRILIRILPFIKELRNKIKQEFWNSGVVE